MKKIAVWTCIAAFAAFLIVWGVMGVMILDHDYEYIDVFTCVGVACAIVGLVSLIYLRSAAWKCPHCGKVRLVKGKFCYHCGKEIG